MNLRRYRRVIVRPSSNGNLLLKVTRAMTFKLWLGFVHAIRLLNCLHVYHIVCHQKSLSYLGKQQYVNQKDSTKSAHGANLNREALE